MLSVHGALARAGRTGFAAFRRGGAVAALAITVAVLLTFNLQPAHGFVVDGSAGAA